MTPEAALGRTRRLSRYADRVLQARPELAEGLVQAAPVTREAVRGALEGDAAGLGTRLRPLTDVRAKPAIPVAGEPMIRRIIRWLVTQGVDRLQEGTLVSVQAEKGTTAVANDATASHREPRGQRRRALTHPRRSRPSLAISCPHLGWVPATAPADTIDRARDRQAA